MNLQVGQYYTRWQIHDILGGETQSVFPQVKGKIVCGCFSKVNNPDAPERILVGDRPKVIGKALLLSKQSVPIPVFVKGDIYDK